ncbi:MAG TPA: hypothetical protein VKA84_29295 [Gemmatimonadaceae bacterium]|nr:hypothetical protein [Gemmatimonadaceae bacterium]
MLLLRVVLLALAGFALHRELVGVNAADLLGGMRRFGWQHVALSLLFTVASFLTLGAFELLALRHAGAAVARAVPRRVALRTAYVAHAFSQSAGVALLTGAAVRLRAYPRYGLDAVAVARVSAFVTATALLGLLATGAVAVLATSAPLRVGHAALGAGWTAAMLAAPALAYLAWSAFGGSSAVGRGRWRLRRPPPGLATVQLALSALDWLLTATVLYFLLPPTLSASYPMFLGACLLGMTAGVVSQLPGGIGVFEATLLALLAPAGSAAAAGALAASLVAYRIIYYVLPLCGAVAVFVFTELRARDAASRSHAD